MKEHTQKSVQNLLKTEDQRLAQLHQIVADSLKEEKLISRRLRKEYQEKPSTGERLADKVASFGGSWKFIIFFSLVLLSWILLNAYFLSAEAFDPYPFILLNLVLSCVAALQAPIILMSQNRQESKDRKRAEHDYLINLKAEIEIRSLHQKIDVLILEQMKALLDTQKQQIAYLEEIRKDSTKIR